MALWFSPNKRSRPTDEQPTQRSPTQSLLHYETGSPPPSARVDPKIKLQPRRPLRVWDYWKVGFIVAAKATEVTTDVFLHHIFGPRRKSWGIEMTIVTSLIRGAERHSALVDIGTMRMLMGIGGLVPLPSDALVSPVTFRVKRRNLRGILAEFDAKETGKRELSGEWVVGRKTWHRMQSEWKAATKSAAKATKGSSGHSNINLADDFSNGSSKKKERVILYIHGGAYYLSSAAAQRLISIPLAKYTDSRVFAVDYRLAPESQFPGPLHDVVSAYLRLVEELHIPSENIILCGDSAGGGLTVALLMYLRDNGYTLPSGAILLSPWVDLTMSCESWESNRPYDVVPFPTADNHMNPIALYLGDRIEEYLTHPYASPLFGDFKGLPPLLIQAGDAEVLRDEITLLAHKATLAGVQVKHEIYEDAIHVFHAYPFLDASRLSFEAMRRFVCDVLPKCQSRSPQMLASTVELSMEKEIENERSVLVSGDGLEDKVPQFRSERKKSVQNGEGGKQSGGFDKIIPDEDNDGASWVRSPVWPPTKLDLSGMENVKVLESDKGDFEHIERIDLNPDDIPHLSLSPPPHSSVSPHDVSVLPPSSRPLMSTIVANSTGKPKPSGKRDTTPVITVVAVPEQDSRPRRNQSGGSLATFVYPPPRNTSEVSSSRPSRDPTPKSNSFNFGFNLFAPSRPPSPSKQHSRSRSGTVTLPDLDGPLLPALPFSASRKRRAPPGQSMANFKSRNSLSATNLPSAEYPHHGWEGTVKTTHDNTWSPAASAN